MGRCGGDPPGSHGCPGLLTDREPVGPADLASRGVIPLDLEGRTLAERATGLEGVGRDSSYLEDAG